MIYYPAGHAGFNDDQYPELPENYYDFLADVAIPDSIDDLGPGAFYYLKSALKKKYELNNSIDKESVDYYDYLATQIPERLVYVYKALSLERDFRKETYSVFNSDDCPYPDIATLVQKRFKHLEGMLEGAPGPDFTLTDPTGKIVSLNDLKGKYIYIDFWATCCGPCIKEIPSLEKIQHEYRDAPIHFVSISFDQERDSLKWKDYVAEHELKGIQLFADKNQHEILSSRLNIKTIPRFVLLDTEGKMINAKAPRPSNPQLKNVLNELTKH